MYKNTKTKKKLNAMKKKDMFLFFFYFFILKTVSETASLVVIGSIFHRRGPMTKKASSPVETVSFGNVEPSMISLRTEVMMRTTLSAMQNNIRGKVSR